MTVRVITGDCRAMLATLPAESVHCCVTSPPYFGLRDYGVAGQIGLEQTPDAYVAELVSVFREVRRVLRDDGTLWLNLGDSYAGSRAGPQGESGQMNDRSVAAQRCRVRNDAIPGKPKDLLGIPWRVAFALQADGWWLRSDIIWAKPNPMPESVTDRPTSAHEHVFLLAKSERYWFDQEAVREPPTWAEPTGTKVDAGRVRNAGGRDDGYTRIAQGGGVGCPEGGRNIRNVWSIATAPNPEAHFAMMPPAVAEPCIKAGCPMGGTVLDPFGGAGTTGLVADRLGRNAILIELNPANCEMTRKRLHEDAGMFASVAAE